MPHHISKTHKSMRKSMRKTHKKPTMSNKGYAIVKRIRNKGKPAPMHNINYAIRASLIPANNNMAAIPEESIAMNQNLRRSSRAASAAASQKMSKQSKKAKKNTQKKWNGVRYNYYNISSNQGAPRQSVFYHFPASSAAASSSASNLNKMFASMQIK